MKHILKFSLTLLSVSVLAACGGGGGSSKNGDAVGKHLNNANHSNLTFSEQLQKTNQATQLANNASVEAEKGYQKALQQSKVARQAFSNPMKNRSDLDYANAAKTAAETEKNNVKAKLEEAKALVTLAQKHYDAAEKQVRKAQQEAINATKVAQQHNQNTLPIVQNLTPEQKSLLEASRTLSSEEINKKVEETKRVATEMSSQLALAARALSKAQQAQAEIAQHLNNTNDPIAANLKSTNLVNPKVLRESEQSLKESKTLHIGIHEISLADENFGYFTKDIENKQLKVYNLGYSGVGYVLSKNAQTDEYGQLLHNVVERHKIGETANLPTEGTFTYYGQSFGAKTDGVLMLKADFGNKKVEGTVTERRLTDTKQALSDITLQQTDIGGGKNHFEGIASYKTGNINVTGRYEGNFKSNFEKLEAQEVVGYIFDGKNHFYEGFAGKAEVNESLLGN
ncbi:hypothetical protein A1D29_00750 [Pasteurellaceae bacterium Orientalotternb1]|nr:hypothetical protein A1D29_00750 [Pasteurellaceae bacterium Orientalotternb1]